MADMLSTPKSIKEIINGEDGHVYYVIAGDGKEIRMGIVYLERFEDLTRHIGQPGLFFVRDAACKYENPDDYTSRVIQNGDPTVHEGWAMYCWDVYKDNNKAGWRKVAEQESVDGPWGIDERILKMLVKRSEFNSYVEQNNTRVTDLEERVSRAEDGINGLNGAVAELQEKAHTHDNKLTLDGFGESGDALTWRGVILGGSFYVYRQYQGNMHIWKDPTDPEAEGIVVDTAKDVADRFVQTTIAAKGMTLVVVEPDESYTQFDILEEFYQEEPEEGSSSGGEWKSRLVVVPHGCVVRNGLGQITYVDKLDINYHHLSKAYINRGIFCPLTDDGNYQPFELYIYDVDHGWTPLKKKYGAGTVIGKTGAVPTFCYTEEDPELPYKKHHLFWADDTTFVYTDPDTGVTFSWDHSVIVRKFGSVPTNIEDGEIVFTSTKATDGGNGFTDVCPYNNEEVHYQIFSVTKLGAVCSVYDPDGFVPKTLEWKDIQGLISENTVKRNLREKLLPVGTILVLPKHPLFGKIEVKVIGSTTSSLTMVTTEALKVCEHEGLGMWINKMFSMHGNVIESNYGIAQTGKTYYYFDPEEGYTELEVNEGDELPEGKVFYELDPEYPNGVYTGAVEPGGHTIGFDLIEPEVNLRHSKTKVGWWDINGNKSADTEQTGVILTFEIRP